MIARTAYQLPSGGGEVGAAMATVLTVIAPIEIPVGIVTAILGGPFFIYLLVRGERAV